MTVIDHIRRYETELTAIRRDIHAHPELGLEEQRTAELVARTLESYGIEVHRRVGKTGIVGVLRSGNGPATIGLRADMDALPMSEQTGRPYASQNPGKMHACGHDGHTTMLLGAARYLAETRNFNGTVNFIFQPGEEGCGGALAMLEDGLFERFPCDAVFGMHNWPGMPIGQYGIKPGAFLAGGAFFDIEIRGKGSHGAKPEMGVDPVLTACHVNTALQSIVSRNVRPADTAVVSVTKISGGDAYNVIPQTAHLGGTVRAFRKDVLTLAEERMREIAQGVASGFGATAKLDFRVIFAPLTNSAEHTRAIADTAAEIVGEASVDRAAPALSGSEDFAFMLEKVPGAYILLGNGDSADPHNPTYDFNDEVTPFGASVYARLIEREMPRGVS
jgi:amidohydrolase